ncbi:MAG: hypothetical protein JWQ98_2548 [Chlorobi bacterium]|nr:hypothetical protein [Chlorobiota bacterium]
MRRLRTRLFGLSPDEATFERRGFPACGEHQRRRLETIGRTFLTGYHAALDARDSTDLRRRLDGVELELRGFAFEGAGMALGMMDMLLPWRRDRWRSFAESEGQAHIYMLYVGLGWALARMRRRVEAPLAARDPLIRWLALDGYGFHEGYFHWREVAEEHAVPARLKGYARRAFDQGVGRSLWFIYGADVVRIASCIGGFPESRRADLWSGVGLASAYAGGVEKGVLDHLVGLSGLHFPALAQGVLFATETRLNAGNLLPHTTLACRTICNISVEQASAMVNIDRRELRYDAAEPAYEIWRSRLQSHFSPQAEFPMVSSPLVRPIAYHDTRSLES